MADHRPDENADGAGQHRATNAEWIRTSLRRPPYAVAVKTPPERDQTTRSLQLGLAVQRNQMQRSLTHALLGVGLGFPLLVADDPGTAGWIIGVLLSAHAAIQVFDFHRALGYYNHGVDRLNLALQGKQPKDRASSEAPLWFRALFEKPHAIHWPESGESLSLSSRSHSNGTASS